MKPRSLIAIVSLATIALFGAACGTKATPDNVAVPPTPAEARTDLEAAFTKSDAETTTRLSMTSESISLVTETDRTAKVMHAISKVNMAGTEGESEVLIIEGIQYIRSYEKGGAKPKWSKDAAAGAAAADQFKGMFAADDLLTDKSKVTEVSPGKYRVEAAGKGKGLFEGLDEAAGDAPASMTFTLDAQGRVAEIELQTKDGAVTFKVEYGVTLDVKAPAASEIE